MGNGGFRAGLQAGRCALGNRQLPGRHVERIREDNGAGAGTMIRDAQGENSCSKPDARDGFAGSVHEIRHNRCVGIWLVPPDARGSVDRDGSVSLRETRH